MSSGSGHGGSGSGHGRGRVLSSKIDAAAAHHYSTFQGMTDD